MKLNVYYSVTQLLSSYRYITHRVTDIFHTQLRFTYTTKGKSLSSLPNPSVNVTYLTYQIYILQLYT